MVPNNDLDQTSMLQNGIAKIQSYSKVNCIIFFVSWMDILTFVLANVITDYSH